MSAAAGSRNRNRRRTKQCVSRVTFSRPPTPRRITSAPWAPLGIDTVALRRVALRREAADVQREIEDLLPADLPVEQFLHPAGQPLRAGVLQRPGVPDRLADLVTHF